MRFAYADPPYPGCAHRYKGHADFGGEVDHAALIARLESEFDGWLLHTSSTALQRVLALCPPGVRVMSWVKPFAAFKRNVSVAYAWEPVIVKAIRKPVVTGRVVMRDWVSESITLKKGLCGAKPVKVCQWAFEVAGLEPSDEFHDLYPGTGIVKQTWDAWVSDRLLELNLARRAPSKED